jgi:branched-subunit amino acid transport protein
MDTLLIFCGMALVTYLTRYAAIAALGGEMPPRLRRWLRYVPPAMLAALIAPAALAPKGHLAFGISAWAVLAGAAIA